MSKRLYTFFLEYKGGTYVSQVKASSPAKALAAWAEALDDTKVHGLGKTTKTKLTEEARQPPTLVEGVENTWCSSVLLRGDLALIHFTLTEE